MAPRAAGGGLSGTGQPFSSNDVTRQPGAPGLLCRWPRPERHGRFSSIVSAIGAHHLCPATMRHCTMTGGTVASTSPPEAGPGAVHWRARLWTAQGCMARQKTELFGAGVVRYRLHTRRLGNVGYSRDTQVGMLRPRAQLLQQPFGATTTTLLHQTGSPQGGCLSIPRSEARLP